MSEIDEILGVDNKSNDYSTTRKYKNYKSKKQNDWRTQQRKDKQAICDTMERMTTIIANDGEKFQEYLDIQSRFVKYSVGNCLVLLETAPNSTQIRDKKSWEEKGVSLIENAKEIKILEPKEKYGKWYYNPKTVYDISQTNLKPQEKSIYFDNRKLLEALLYHCNVTRKAVEYLKNNEIGAEYNKEENTLYVCKSMDRETLFQTLCQEIGNIEMKDEEDSNIKNFRSYCISYLICKRYGVDTSNFDFKDLPIEIRNAKKNKDVRSEIDKIRICFEKIDSKMSDYLEISNKEKNRSAPER